MNYLNKCNWEIINRVRMLWSQHSEWTMMAFTAVIFRNANEREVVQRLLRNPDDFGNFLNCFFGQDFAVSFRNLLTEHLSLAIALVIATMKKNTTDAEKIKERLFRNADELSALLSFASPNWHYNEWQTMLYRHLNLAIQMASEMMEGSYGESIKTYDIFEAEVMLMADLMLKGLFG